MLNFCLICAVNNFDKKAEMCNKNQTNTEEYYPIYYYNWLWTWFKLRQIVKSGKATSMTYVNLAELYEQLFMYKKAKKYVLKAIRKDKNNAFAYCELGILIDDDSISKKYFLKSLDIGCEYDFVSLFYLLLIYFRENDWDKVFDYAREYLNSKTEDPFYWVLAVLIYTIFENAVTPFCEIYTLLKNKKELTGIQTTESQKLNTIFVQGDVPFKYIANQSFSTRAGVAEDVQQIAFFDQQNYKEDYRNLLRGIWCPILGLSSNIKDA